MVRTSRAHRPPRLRASARRRGRMPLGAWLLVGVPMLVLAMLLAPLAGVGDALAPGATVAPDTTAVPSASDAPVPDPELTSPSVLPSAPTTAPTKLPGPGAIPAVDEALAALETLDVRGRAPKTGYSREQFGQRWLDVDRNGCDTRNDILARDLTQVTTTSRCRVQSGILHDPYTGETITFERGEATSPLVQIDHVVALSDAWQKGAQNLTDTERAAFANDPLNLLAVGGAVNSAKGDADAATWLPPNTAYRCEYVSRQVLVKATHRLWVTQAEHDAMTRILTGCRENAASG